MAEKVEPIKIVVKKGIVVDVLNLPSGQQLQVWDYDIPVMEDPKNLPLGKQPVSYFITDYEGE